MSENLTQFLAAWLAWVEAGAPDEDPFDRSYGLCTSFGRWLYARNPSPRIRGESTDYLKSLFSADGLNDQYPFGGEDQFDEDCDGGRMHLNPDRLAWVRAKVEQFATANAK